MNTSEETKVETSNSAMHNSSLKYVGRDSILFPILNLLHDETEPLLIGETRHCSDYRCQFHNLNVLDIRKAIERHVLAWDDCRNKFTCCMDDNSMDLAESLLEKVNAYRFVYRNKNNILFTITVSMEMIGDTSALPNRVKKISVYASSYNQFV